MKGARTPLFSMQYILMRRSFEYNDEIDCPTDGGDPMRIFGSKLEAEDECFRRNLKKICEGDVDQYTYDGMDRIVDIVGEYLHDEPEHDGGIWARLAVASLENQKKVVKYITQEVVDFYYVDTVRES